MQAHYEQAPRMKLLVLTGSEQEFRRFLHATNTHPAAATRIREVDDLLADGEVALFGAWESHPLANCVRAQLDRGCLRKLQLPNAA